MEVKRDWGEKRKNAWIQTTVWQLFGGVEIGREGYRGINGDGWKLVLG